MIDATGLAFVTQVRKQRQCSIFLPWKSNNWKRDAFLITEKKRASLCDLISKFKSWWRKKKYCSERPK